MLTILSKMSSNVLMTTVPVFTGVDFNIWADILLSWLQATGLSSVLSADRPSDAEVSTASPLSAEDAAAQAEAITAAQKKQADWDEKNDKAIGSIRLRLSQALREKTFGITSAKKLWATLKETYGKPGASAVYTDFKRATSITIPNDAHPGAAIELIRMHFDRVSTAGIPTDTDDTSTPVSMTKIPNFLIVMAKEKPISVVEVELESLNRPRDKAKHISLMSPLSTRPLQLTSVPKGLSTLHATLALDHLTGSDADMACAQGEDASWNEDTLVNTSELGSVFGTTTTESGAKVSQDIRTPVPLIDRIATDPAAEMTECAMYLGERFQNPEDPLHIYGEPLRAALNTVAPTGTHGTLSLVQRLAAVRSERPSGSQPAPPNGMTTQSLPSSRVASPTPGTTSTGWEWLTPHLQNEDGRYDELIDWQRDATIGLGGMELPSRAPTPSSMPELRSVSPSLSETSDLEYMSTPPSIGRMSLPTSPIEDTASYGIPSPRSSTPVMVTVNAANNYGWSLDSEPNGMDNGYLRSYE
ncbi:hypothetical protein D9758_017804 [Tetrapyrgos nigripes]|uniref:Uncharacterized protein n=1 Tax=Tetrapyrgos nigripes TaxID=182062 RepID=A0A8H5B7Y9_9AGAR|nr:hypothetical protein D9758_017804 [Tetrapyrgos nigripes]